MEVNKTMLAPTVANWRTWISPIVAVSFVTVAGTGVLMLVEFRGGGLHGLHEMAGLLFAVAGAIHLVINWRAFLACFRHRAALVSVAIVTALCLTLAVFSGQHGDRERGRRLFHGDSIPRGFRR